MAQPFLRCPGGKSRLVKEYLDILLPIEPAGAVFPTVGGGAVELALLEQDARIGEGPIIFGDKSPDVILAWTALRDNLDGLVPLLMDHAVKHSSVHFYETRLQYPEMKDEVERAAAFIYMNKTNYNGLTRVNRAGKPNAPLGKDSKKQLLKANFDFENLRQVSQVIQDVTLRCGDFADTVKGAEPNSLVFIDPPYLHESGDAKKGFTGYTAGGFSAKDHMRLAFTFHDLHDLGAHVALCGAETAMYRDLFRDYHIWPMRVRRDVGCTPESRGTVSEILVTNFDRKKDTP